jgi:hypothetical protein
LPYEDDPPKQFSTSQSGRPFEATGPGSQRTTGEACRRQNHKHITEKTAVEKYRSDFVVNHPICPPRIRYTLKLNTKDLNSSPVMQIEVRSDDGGSLLGWEVYEHDLKDFSIRFFEDIHIIDVTHSSGKKLETWRITLAARTSEIRVTSRRLLLHLREACKVCDHRTNLHLTDRPACST